jgi:peptidoglycan/LPS O-acetylase OafA/YrhL
MQFAAQSQRLHWIDTVRGAAAIWVVLFHLNTVDHFSPTAYQGFADLGWLGVIAFFVVSGLSIGMAAGRTTSIGEYAWHRFWRIYPPYIGSLVVVVLIISGRKLLTGTTDFISLPKTVGGWIAQTLVVTRPVTPVRPINWVYWSLSYEIVFYMLAGVGVWIKPLKWPVLIGTSIAACLAGRHPPTFAFFLNYWSFFALGAALAEFRAKPGPLPILIFFLCGVDFLQNQTPPAVVAATATLLSCGLCMNKFGDSLNKETCFRSIGQWSYSLYLVHVPIGCWAYLSIVTKFGGPGIRHHGLFQHILVDTGGVTASCFAAWLFWTCIERPSMAIMRRPVTRTVRRRHNEPPLASLANTLEPTGTAEVE